MARPQFPPSLDALAALAVVLPRRGEVPLERFRVEFNSSPKPVSSAFQQAWAAKPQVSCDGQALFPEIAVLSLFHKEGWDGVWADVPRRRYYARMPTMSKGVTLDTHVAQTLSRIAAAGEGAKTSCWDLVLWHGRSVFFAAVREAAERRDGEGGGAVLRKAEIQWLEAGLRTGMTPTQFIVIEWGYRRVVVGRKRQQNRA